MTNETTQGVVERVSQKDGKYGIKIGENWYNGFGDAGCKEGDKIEVVYVINGQWKNVESIEIIESSPNKPDTSLEASRRRHATDCILKAADMVIADKIAYADLTGEAQKLFKAIDTIVSESDESDTE